MSHRAEGIPHPERRVHCTPSGGYTAPRAECIPHPERRVHRTPSRVYYHTPSEVYLPTRSGGTCPPKLYKLFRLNFKFSQNRNSSYSSFFPTCNLDFMLSKFGILVEIIFPIFGRFGGIMLPKFCITELSL